MWGIYLVLRYNPIGSGSYCEIIRKYSVVEMINSVILYIYWDSCPFNRIISNHGKPPHVKTWVNLRQIMLYGFKLCYNGLW
jgi:hypothetical protein